MLDLSGDHTFTGSVKINEGILKIERLKNGDQPSAIGASSSDPSNLVLNGGTLQLTGTASTSDRDITIAAMGGTMLLSGTSADLTLNGSIAGTGLLKKNGDGDLTLTKASDWSGGLLVKDGNVILGSEEANVGGLGTGKLTLENSTLRMLNNTSTDTDNCDYDLVIPRGSGSWLHLDGRSSLIGTLEGSGTLNLVSPFIRSELDGDWSAFSGRIKVSTNSSDATFLVGNQNGFENAAIELSDDVAIVYINSEDASIKIGELSGTSGSELGAGGQASNNITWMIGDRNTNATFHGLISDRQFKNSGAKTSIIKSGTGVWTLNNANTYTGTTEIKGGSISVENTSGSATGTGDVLVRSGGGLRGNGSIAGNLLVETGASLSMGEGSELGIMTINKNVDIQPGAYLSTKLNTIDKTADKLVVKGLLKLDGILYISNDGGNYVLGESYQILETDSTTGNVSMIIPASPGEGLEWDTRWLNSYGFISIVAEGTVGIEQENSPLKFSLSPNPGSHRIKISLAAEAGSDATLKLRCYNQSGSLVHQEKFDNSHFIHNSFINVQAWDPGIYLVEISGDNKNYIQRFIKQ